MTADETGGPARAARSDGADGAAGAAGADGREPAVPVCLLLTDDLPVRRRMRQLAAEHRLAIADAEPPEGAGQPAVAVIDLNLPDALERIRRWRARWPSALLAGYLGVPDRERWVAAQRAGCDLVSNRGALVLRLRGQLARAAPAGRAFPLFDAADAAGRLGLVFASDDTPVGPLAVYQVAGVPYAISGRCPHAGAALSGGEVEAGVVTCPRHGSRFDVRTGERVRGPADCGVASHRLVQEGGQVFLVLPG